MITQRKFLKNGRKNRMKSKKDTDWEHAIVICVSMFAISLLFLCLLLTEPEEKFVPKFHKGDVVYIQTLEQKGTIEGLDMFTDKWFINVWIDGEQKTVLVYEKELKHDHN
jgi:hypothetical protein